MVILLALPRLLLLITSETITEFSPYKEIWNLKLNNSVNCLVYLKQSNEFATCLNNNSILIWRDNEIINTLNSRLRDNLISIVALEENTIVASYKNGKFIIWNIVNATQSNTFNDLNRIDYNMLTVLSDNILACSDGHQISFWNLKINKKVYQLIFEIYRYPIKSLTALTNDRLAYSSGDGSIRIYNYKIHKELKFKELEKKGFINDLVNKDDKNLISTTDDKIIKIWNIKNGTVIERFQTKESLSKIIKLSNDYLASIALKSIKIWDLKSGTAIQTLNNSLTKHLIVLLDGTLVSSSGQYIKIWKN